MSRGAATEAAPPLGAGQVARLVARQVRYENRVFWRTPVAAFFTIVFPVMLLIIFTIVFDGTLDFGRGEVSIAQFYTPALAVYAAASATYVNLAVGTANAREAGVLKRVRGTPLPPWIYMAGRIGSGIWIAVLGVALMLAIGVLAYDLEIAAATVPAALVSLAVGVAAFAALGLALAAFASSENAAVAIANATILPLAFLSGVFIPLQDPPAWLEPVADVFPLKPFVDSFSEPFLPFVAGSAFQPADLAVMAAWGVVGMVVALRYFRWEARGERGTG